MFIGSARNIVAPALLAQKRTPLNSNNKFEPVLILRKGGMKEKKIVKSKMAAIRKLDYFVRFF